MIHDSVPTPDPATAQAASAHEERDARSWVRLLANYREPSRLRSAVELLITLVPFVALWALAWWSLSVSYALATAIAALNGAFLVRLFLIQHDCGHASFFKNRSVNDWVGRSLGVLTVTPYNVWRRAHAHHHSAAGNLDKRGMGDVLTLTVDEYRGLSRFGRLRYRLYRHPLVLFGLGPSYVFLLANRLPVGLMRSGWKYWASAMGTNLMMLLVLGAIAYFGGVAPLVFVFLPTTVVAASIGIWLFYVQHQFEETSWDEEPDWQLHDAALHGSSHYILPGVLRWFSANIGVHHVHHLQSRVPFYRLPEILNDHPELNEAQRLTIRESFRTVGLQLWDEKSRRLVSFAQAKAI
ncbi:omega-6 fatty acid desaturase (delta-12 desaturase) [Palleronia marisminoris]|uniref:Fatty acid desaturase n=1 Tax=Palleronia marisminoris TaxID=315423 RepID=A0A1Y5TDF4_9RHOB|nr:omega-6 fatty acid desaturase (delta-12 desaturase) [Palleronia marisminoris]SLN61196.1 Fatty acid desaturase [Palleronia marisminoris]